MSLPITETFHSIQGEGFWSGTPMHFIRLAGCPVGKKATRAYLEESSGSGTTTELPILQNGMAASICQTYDGRFFTCDTDFSCYTYKTVSELVGETWQQHVCLTGGEPLSHLKQLVEQGFFKEFFKRGVMIHVETSGTVQLPLELWDDNRLWVTCAPKLNAFVSMVDRADEVKLLVDDDFHPDKLGVYKDIITKKDKVFLCAVNGEKQVSRHNTQMALEWLYKLKLPGWRLGYQLHKAEEVQVR